MLPEQEFKVSRKVCHKQEISFYSSFILTNIIKLNNAKQTINLNIKKSS